MSNDKRISDAMEQALNKQMMEEATQAQAYIALGSWAEVTITQVLQIFSTNIRLKNVTICSNF